MNPDTILTSQETANRFLLWFAEEQNMHPAARYMVGVMLYGPRFDMDKGKPFPRDLTAFLCCLRAAETCLCTAAFNRLRLVSRDWNAVVDAWDELRRAAYANAGLEPGEKPFTYSQKEDLYEAALNRHRINAPLTWCVPVEPKDWAAIRDRSTKKEIEFAGNPVYINVLPSELIPPNCNGILEVGDAHGYVYLMVAPGTNT